MPAFQPQEKSEVCKKHPSTKAMFAKKNKSKLKSRK